MGDTAARIIGTALPLSTCSSGARRNGLEREGMGANRDGPPGSGPACRSVRGRSQVDHSVVVSGAARGCGYVPTRLRVSTGSDSVLDATAEPEPEAERLPRAVTHKWLMGQAEHAGARGLQITAPRSRTAQLVARGSLPPRTIAKESAWSLASVRYSLFQSPANARRTTRMKFESTIAAFWPRTTTVRALAKYWPTPGLCSFSGPSWSRDLASR